MKRIICLVLSLLLIASTLVFASAEQEKIKIGFANYDVGNTWCTELAAGVIAAGEKYNVEVQVDYCSADAAKQMTVIENYITMGFNVVILVAVDAAGIEETLKEAMNKGIYVIASAIETPVYDVYVSAKEEDMGSAIGTACGQWLNANKSGEGKVAILDYPGLAQMVVRENAMIKALAETCPGSEVVMQVRASTPEEGLNAGEAILQAYPTIDAIIGYNDSGVLGASQAVEAAGRDVNSIFIGGVDATAEALKKIAENNYYNASVDNAPYANGMQLVEIGISLCNGEKMDKVIAVPIVTVDKTNISDYMK